MKIKTLSKKTSKASPKSAAPPKTPLDQNIHASLTILKNSFGSQSARLEDGFVTVTRDKVLERVQDSFAIGELSVGIDPDDGEFMIIASLRFDAAKIDPDKLMRTIYEMNNDKVTFGSFRVRENAIAFVVGFCGASDTDVPAIVLADTLAYALDMATAGQEYLIEKLTPAKRTKAPQAKSTAKKSAAKKKKPR